MPFATTRKIIRKGLSPPSHAATSRRSSSRRPTISACGDHRGRSKPNHPTFSTRRREGLAGSQLSTTGPARNLGKAKIREPDDISVY